MPHTPLYQAHGDYLQVYWPHYSKLFLCLWESTLLKLYRQKITPQKHGIPFKTSAITVRNQQFLFEWSKHTCSENSATNMKSLWNCAAVLQGWEEGKRGTESSSGRPWASCSSSSSPKPSVLVKASRSGDPIILTRWRVSPQEGISEYLWSTPQGRKSRLRAQTPPCRGAAQPTVRESAVHTGPNNNNRYQGGKKWIKTVAQFFVATKL